MSELELRNVHKYYGDVHAVRGVDLHIPEGEFTVLVGPSGCGKSTLLRTIAGLEKSDDGDVLIGGQVVNNMRPRDRNVAMVFQSYALYPYMKVFDNIAFGLRARKTPESEVTQRVNKAAQMLDIGELLDRFPRQLSGGQRQRVAIGRAVVRDASLFLFDEPLSNLDAQLRDEMRVEIKRLHHSIGKTSIYVTHDQIEAMTLADRIVLLKDGSIEQQGSPLELFEQPATRFVAGFLGSPQMNFIECTLRQSDGRLAFQFDDGRRLAIPDQRSDALAAQVDRTLVLGLRPEHISRPREGEAPRPGQVPLTVNIDLLQPTGTRVYAAFKLDRTEVTAELQAHDVEQLGESVELLVDMARSVVIDPDTDRVL